jgi:hypothetical protein
MDFTLLWPQLVSLGFVAVCLAYWQIILVPTAQVKFNLQVRGHASRQLRSHALV